MIRERVADRRVTVDAGAARLVYYPKESLLLMYGRGPHNRLDLRDILSTGDRDTLERAAAVFSDILSDINDELEDRST